MCFTIENQKFVNSEKVHKEFNFSFNGNNSIFIQCIAGLIGGQQIGEAFFTAQPLQLNTLLWMGTQIVCLLSRVKPLTIFTSYPCLYTALQVSGAGIIALNALALYPSKQDAWVEKLKNIFLNYTRKTVSLLSILNFMDGQRPTKILALAASILITVLNEKGKFPQLMTTCWNQSFSGSQLSKSLYFVGTTANLGKINCLSSISTIILGQKIVKTIACPFFSDVKQIMLS